MRQNAVRDGSDMWEFLYEKSLYSFFLMGGISKNCMGHPREPCPYLYFIFFSDCILHMDLM